MTTKVRGKLTLSRTSVYTYDKDPGSRLNVQPLRTTYRFINKQSNLMKTREPKLQTQAREKLGTESPGAP